jgi:hypothetical protein
MVGAAIAPGVDDYHLEGLLEPLRAEGSQRDVHPGAGVVRGHDDRDDRRFGGRIGRLQEN